MSILPEHAVVLAPMEGVTDPAMRELQGEIGGFSWTVSEFVRVTQAAVSSQAFLRAVPELENDGRTRSGLDVHVQILGGNAELMAESACNAVSSGARSIDLNFGCPAKTVNRHDGGASLLRSPERIREVVGAVRRAVPRPVTVSAKLRLGWEDPGEIFEVARMAIEGRPDWITVHARTRNQGYNPPAHWPLIAQAFRGSPIPVIANGDMWTFNDVLRCLEESQCQHVMLGRAALANPGLSLQCRSYFRGKDVPDVQTDWNPLFLRFVELSVQKFGHSERGTLLKLKQWANLAHRHGVFQKFERVKRAMTIEEFFLGLAL